jgi:hypothetical protein
LTALAPAAAAPENHPESGEVFTALLPWHQSRRRRGTGTLTAL